MPGGRPKMTEDEKIAHRQRLKDRWAISPQSRHDEASERLRQRWVKINEAIKIAKSVESGNVKAP